VPTVVPPVAQDVGALGCGPNTVKLMDPVGDVPPESVALTADAAIAVPAEPVDGAVIEVVGEVFEVVMGAADADGPVQACSTGTTAKV
jgi:hypothetical protein